MSSWRDDLPPIPAERIHDNAVREGRRRQDQRRQQRRQMFTIAGFGLAAAAVVGIVTASLITDRADNGDQAAEATVSPADTAAATTSPAGTSPAGTSPAATEAPAETTADTVPEGTEAAASETTQGGDAAAATTVPVSDEVFVAPGEVWELGLNGPVCGPTEFTVTYAPLETAVSSATMRWAVAGVFYEALMTTSDNVATATVGAFPPGSLGAGDSQPLRITVIAVEPSGATRQLRPPADVVLRDCAG